MTLLRKCCCGDVPSGPCDVCDFCDCECTKSITITISGSYAANLRLETSGSCTFDVCSPYCNEEPDFVQVGDCVGVATVSGSLTIPLIESDPAGSTVTVSGTCSNSSAEGCSEWAGFGSPLSVSFAANSSQTQARRIFQACTPDVESDLFSPCDVIRECTWNCMTSSGQQCGAEWEYETAKTLIAPIESFAKLRCNTGTNTGTLFVVPYIQSCKHAWRPCNGDSYLSTAAPSISLGWSQQRDCPSDSSLTYNTSGWISCNVSIS